MLIQNRQGKTRLERYWKPYTDSERKLIRSEVHRLVAFRDLKTHTNIVPYKHDVIVFRKYAGLYVSLCVEKNDNPLFALEAIHMFIEVLDTFFGSVCELDIVFHFNNVYAALDEIILAGELQETSKMVLLGRLEEFETLQA
ncbi:hypothetical protein DASB73_010270 [Starmerella bacillaris]|uniref:AP complex subunit sigma n=1 Tax=Starmerella bacillaris TaxID=1247836 RepID=A0AAV5REZ0_STABA|nr:hypothetical protein DASB73_010270 [Starmerella bacillaris]